MSDLINSSEAANMLEGTGPTEIVPQQAPVEAAPVAETLYEVKVNGQTLKVPMAELTGGYSRQQDYTRKTAELADTRRQIDAEVNQYREQISQVQQFFSDPRVQQALAGLRAGVTDPNQPLTSAQAQQLYQSQAQAQEQQMNTRLEQIAQQIEVRTLAASYKQEVDSTIGQVLQKHPVLGDIDGIESMLKQKVAERNPQTLDEAKKYFTEIAQGVAQRLESRFQTQQKQQAIAQGQLVKGGIEPPGGTVVPMQGEAKPMKLGSKDLLQAAMNDLMAGSQK